MQPTGSMQGDLSALKQVMAQQGMGTGILDQVTAQAPQAAQKPPTPMPLQSAGGPPQPNMAAQPATAPTGLPEGNPEASMIIKALGSRLSTLGKLETAKLGV